VILRAASRHSSTAQTGRERFVRVDVVDKELDEVDRGAGLLRGRCGDTEDDVADEAAGLALLAAEEGVALGTEVSIAGALLASVGSSGMRLKSASSSSS